MKKVENNSMIIGFLFAIGIFIFFISYTVFSLYPSILNIETTKDELREKIAYHNTLKSKGFDFGEFKNLNSKGISSFGNNKLKELLGDDFYKKIYSEFDKEFYNESIYNTSYESFEGQDDFLEYLRDKNKDLDNIILGQEFNDKVSKLSKVLPKYSTFIEFDNEKGLSDLAFINYIEKLLNKYNLKTNDSIGIKDIIPVDNDIVTNDDNIYYIPLSLELEGSKLSILNFLRYIKNTGDIKFVGDDFDFSKKVGSTSQVSEIDKLEIKKYIDDSYDSRDLLDDSLEKFLSSTNQANDIINIIVDIKFYVSGLSIEKIKDKINFIIGNNNKQVVFDEEGKPKKNEETGETEYILVHYNYNNLLNIAKKFRSNPLVNKNTYYKRKIDNIFKYLNNKDIKKEFNEIRKALSKGKDIDSTYKKALQYKEIFLKLDNDLYIVAKSLGLDTNRIDEESGKVIQNSIYPSNYIFENK